MRVSIDDLVPAIHALYVEEFGKACHFHLSACPRCGGPTNGYPCLCCRSWADYSDTEDYVARERASNDARGVGGRERFERMVEESGGFGALYFGTFRRVLAYTGEKNHSTGGYRQEPDAEFVRHVDALVERAQGIAWPTGGEVWDLVSGAKVAIPHQDFWSERRAELKSILAETHGADAVDEIVRRPDPRRVNPRSFPENCPEAVAALREQSRRTIERLGLAPESGDEPSPDEAGAFRM